MVRVRERVQEVVDFAKTESPYRSATKGWITDEQLERLAKPLIPSGYGKYLLKLLDKEKDLI